MINTCFSLKFDSHTYVAGAKTFQDLFSDIFILSSFYIYKRVQIFSEADQAIKDFYVGDFVGGLLWCIMEDLLCKWSCVTTIVIHCVRVNDAAKSGKWIKELSSIYPSFVRLLKNLDKSLKDIDCLRVLIPLHFRDKNRFS